MSLSIGIVGLPNVGKSSLFTALTRQKVLAANYPFATIDPNVGIVPVPDARLDALAQIDAPARVVPATVEFVDIAGLVKGASAGEGLGNQFLANIRQTDAIIEVLRYFSNSEVVHLSGEVDPERDAEIIKLELVLADLETVEKALVRVEKEMKRDRSAKDKYELLKKLQAGLNEGQRASSMGFDDEERSFLSSLHLLTMKPLMYVANVDESSLGGAMCTVDSMVPVSVSAQLEADLSELDPAEAREYLEELGVDEGGLSRLVREAYRLLGLQSFFTSGPKETRAWTIPKGCKAPQAAGVIHSDFERGFIKAETASYEDYIAYGGAAGCRSAGKLRQEGKDYIVRDGDVMHFKFNV